jgi:hypothetical protein
MNGGVPQIIAGLVCIVVGSLVIKTVSDLGWLIFLLGVILGCRGGIQISQSGAKEIGN